MADDIVTRLETLAESAAHWVIRRDDAAAAKQLREQETEIERLQTLVENLQAELQMMRAAPRG